MDNHITSDSIIAGLLKQGPNFQQTNTAESQKREWPKEKVFKNAR